MKKDLPIAVMTLSVTMIYILGMVFWDDMPKDAPFLNNLYYISTASVLYLLSVIINIISTSLLMKVVSYVSMGVFSVNLYVELFLDPTNWTAWDLGLLIVVPLNIAIMAFIIEKNKTIKK